MQSRNTYLLAVGLALAASGCGGGDDHRPGEVVVEREQAAAPAPDDVQAANGYLITDDRFWTWEGVFEGRIVDGMRIFRGIPYAKPPLGPLRFAPPGYPETVDDVYDAKVPAPTCARPVGDGMSGSEDCLYLDIWQALEDADEEYSPIIVFLPGREVLGEPGLMSGARLAEATDSIVITVNYRLDVLGFLASDNLIAASADNTAGNYGVQDVIAALRWVNQNAKSFHGDVNRVLVTGHSDSARLLCHLLAAPEADGLYHALALQSPPCGDRLYLAEAGAESSPYPAAVTFGNALETAAACDDPSVDAVQCLRDLPLATLLEIAQSVPRIGLDESPFRPLIDGVVVTSDPHQAMRSEHWPGTPLIIGSNRLEMNNLLDGVSVPDDAAYRMLLAESFATPLDEQLYAVFPTDDYPDAKSAYVDLFTHITYGCEAEALAVSAATRGRAYLYDLARGFDAGDHAGMGAVHGIEVPYLFNTFEAVGYVPDEAALDISRTMHWAWWALAARPNQAPWISWIQQWAPYQPGSEQTLLLDEPVAMLDSHRDGLCQSLWPLIRF